MDKKEARIVLGVNKETSRNDIEKKYSILLKKNRIIKEQRNKEDELNGEAVQNGNTPKETGDVYDKYTFDEITQAYNVLMGYEVNLKEEPLSKAAPLLKKAGIDEKKAKNFFFYYKYHIIAVIVAIIAIVFTVKGCVERVDPDFQVAFIGEINYNETELLKATIKADIPEIIEPGFDGAFISDSAMADQQYAMQTKTIILFAAGDIDIFILDKANFETYAKQGAFANLDEIAPMLGVDMEKNKDYVVKLEVTDEESTGKAADKPEEKHLYGIDISQSTVLKESGVLAKEMVAAISIRCEQQDKAVKVLQLFMKQ